MVKRSFLPLRLKLTLWSALVFLLIQMLAAGVWVVVQRPYERTAREDDLVARAGAVVARLSEPETHLRSRAELRGVVEGLSRGTFDERYALRLYDGEGTPYGSSTDEADLHDVPFVEPDASDETHLERHVVPSSDGALVPVEVATRAFDVDGKRLYLQLVRRARTDGDGLRAFWTFWVYSVVVGLVAAGLAAWWMAGRVVSPIQRLAKAARAVSPTSLEDRIDVGPADSEIARLQHELNDALGRLERGYREQGSFISNVSHELKTPIAVLLSQAQVLKQGDRSPLEYRKFLAVVEEEMRILGRLVESFLVLARVGHGKDLVRTERMLVNDVVLETAEHCATLARHHDVPLVTLLHLSDEGETEPEVEGDPELLRTMFENVVRNALRFSPRGEPVDLRVTCTRDRASIVIRDRGPGIPREHLERVFERFYQVTDSQIGVRGSGLGLAIAKSVAELHNGTISVRNCADRGCEFEILMPLARPAPAGEGDATSAGDAARAGDGGEADAPAARVVVERDATRADDDPSEVGAFDAAEEEPSARDAAVRRADRSPS